MRTFEEHMEEGRARYREASNSRPAVLAAQHAKAAAASFQRAVPLASTLAERASAHKNRCRALGQVACNAEESPEMRLWHLCECVETCGSALSDGERSHATAWLENLAAFIDALLVGYSINVESYGGLGAGIARLLSVAHRASCPRAVRVPLMLAVMETAWRRAVAYSARDDYDAMLRALEQHEGLLATSGELVASLGTTSTEKSQVERHVALADNFSRSLRHARSYQLLGRSRRAVTRITEDDAGEFFVNTYAAMDVLRATLQMAGGWTCPVVEAEASCLLGRCFSRFLKRSQPAVQCYRHCVTVAMAMTADEGLHSRPWFREAQTAVEDDQAERNRAEESQRQARAERLRALVAKELQAVKDANDTLISLARFLCSTYKVPGVTLEGDEVPKTTVLRLIAHFHPDKVATEKDERQFLHEEITKMLNSAYELHFK